MLQNEDRKKILTYSALRYVRELHFWAVMLAILRVRQPNPIPDCRDMPRLSPFGRVLALIRMLDLVINGLLLQRILEALHDQLSDIITLRYRGNTRDPSRKLTWRKK